MRFTKRTIAALTCAFALFPAGSAMAGSGPAPNPSEWTTPTTAEPSPAGNPLSENARAAAVCSDAYPVGETRYITHGGETVASVKQFYSPDCNENYGYVWVWESYRQKHDNYDVSVGVYSYTRDDILGMRAWANSNGQEYWSQGTDTARECTSGIGAVRTPGTPTSDQAASSMRC